MFYPFISWNSCRHVNDHPLSWFARTSSSELSRALLYRYFNLRPSFMGRSILLTQPKREELYLDVRSISRVYATLHLFFSGLRKSFGSQIMDLLHYFTNTRSWYNLFFIQRMLVSPIVCSTQVFWWSYHDLL